MQRTRIRLFLFLVTSSWKFWLDSLVLHLLIHLENCQWSMRWIPWPPELISAYCVLSLHYATRVSFPLLLFNHFWFLLDKRISLYKWNACLFSNTKQHRNDSVWNKKRIRILLWIVMKELSGKFCRKCLNWNLQWNLLS